MTTAKVVATGTKEPTDTPTPPAADNVPEAEMPIGMEIVGGATDGVTWLELAEVTLGEAIVEVYGVKVDD